jgi:RNA polymerase sigma factor (sigma-70 family)
MLSDSPAPGKQFDSASSRQVEWSRRLPQWAPVLESVFKRIRGWRVPPRWSVRDWSEELKALSLAAAWHALGDFDPTYGVPLPVFLRERILATALTRYRQEWAYSMRCSEEVQNEGKPRSPFRHLPAHESFVDAVARLAAIDRWLIEQIFWHGRSEAEVSKHLGISQQAVSKRKKSALRALRRNFE